MDTYLHVWSSPACLEHVEWCPQSHVRHGPHTSTRRYQCDIAWEWTRRSPYTVVDTSRPAPTWHHAAEHSASDHRRRHQSLAAPPLHSYPIQHTQIIDRGYILSSTHNHARIRSTKLGISSDDVSCGHLHQWPRPSWQFGIPATVLLQSSLGKAHTQFSCSELFSLSG